MWIQETRFRWHAYTASMSIHWAISPGFLFPVRTIAFTSLYTNDKSLWSFLFLDEISNLILNAWPLDFTFQGDVQNKNISSLAKDVFPSDFMTSVKSAMLLGFSCYVVALLAWKGREHLRKSRHTWMAEEAAISTNRETRKKPLPQSPPGKENRMSMFLRKRVTVGKAFRKMNGKFVEQHTFPTSLFLSFFLFQK